MKHVEMSKVVTEGRPRFRVWCSHRRDYVLDDASAKTVKEYFAGIAVRRACDAVEELLCEAQVRGPTQRRESLRHH